MQALKTYTKIIQDYPGLALTERARIRRAILLYETGQVSEAILELEDEEVALRGNAEVMRCQNVQATSGIVLRHLLG